MAKSNRKRGDKWMAGPANRSKVYSNGKRREVRAIEKRTRRAGKAACQEN